MMVECWIKKSPNSTPTPPNHSKYLKMLFKTIYQALSGEACYHTPTHSHTCKSVQKSDQSHTHFYCITAVFDQYVCLFSSYYQTDCCCWLLNWIYAHKDFDSESLLILHKNQTAFVLSPVSLQGFKRYICIYKEQKWYPIEENQQCVSSIFSKQICLKN